LRNEYLGTENHLLRSHIKGRIRLSAGERQTLAEIGQKLGKQALQDVVTLVKPDTRLGWHHTLVAQKCDGSPQRQGVWTPPDRSRTGSLDHTYGPGASLLGLGPDCRRPG
jgi:hypothetical protein